MDEKDGDGQRAGKRPARWMLVYLLLVAIAVGGVLAYFKFFPDTVVEAPQAPKQPMHNAPVPK